MYANYDRMFAEMSAKILYIHTVHIWFWPILYIHIYTVHIWYWPITHIHRTYMVLANSIYTPYIYGFGQLYIYTIHIWFWPILYITVHIWFWPILYIHRTYMVLANSIYTPYFYGLANPNPYHDRVQPLT